MSKWFLLARKDRKEHEDDMKLLEEIRKDTAEQRALTPRLMEQAKKLVRAGEENHFVQGLEEGFAAKARGC